MYDFEKERFIFIRVNSFHDSLSNKKQNQIVIIL